MNRYRDFDAFIAERKAEPITFTLGGKLFELPPKLPASVGLKAYEMYKKYGNDPEALQKNVPEHEMFDLAMSLLGSQYNDVIATGIDIDALGELVLWIFSVYSGQDPKEVVDSKNATAPI